MRPRWQHPERCLLSGRKWSAHGVRMGLEQSVPMMSLIAETMRSSGQLRINGTSTARLDLELSKVFPRGTWEAGHVGRGRDIG
jgi:hypothetical protein